MSTKFFSVDTEATAPSPATGVMTEFGIVEMSTDDYFYGQLWPFTPHPEIPALPVVAPDAQPLAEGFAGTFDGVRHDTDRVRFESIDVLMAAAAAWVNGKVGGGNAIFVADNPGFDFMWMACAFDAAGVANPFGFSSRRIGDLAAGFAGDWRQTSRWKSLRTTKHTHDPVDDALGNAGAFRELLRINRQKGIPG